MELMRYRTYSSDIEVLSCRNSFSFAPHIHERYVLWLSCGSSETYSVKGNSGLLEKGSFSILEPLIVHENKSTEDLKRDLRSFYISAGFLDSLCSEINENENARFRLKKGFFQNPALFNKLKDLHQNLLYEEDATEDIYLIFSEIILNYCENTESIDYGLDERRTKIVKEFINDNYQEKVTIAELSDLINVTPFHLIKIFRKKTGMTPHRYLVQIRLEKVREKLTLGADISDASLSCGFSDQSHLTRAFTKRYGITPGQFAK